MSIFGGGLVVCLCGGGISYAAVIVTVVTTNAGLVITEVIKGRVIGHSSQSNAEKTVNNKTLEPSGILF